MNIYTQAKRVAVGSDTAIDLNFVNISLSKKIGPEKKSQDILRK